MDLIEESQRTVDAAQALMREVKPEEMSRQTPCSKWDVRGLVNHMIGVCNNFTAVFANQEMDMSVLRGTDTDLAGDDPGAAYGKAAADLMAALREPGALERSVKLAFGDTPGAFVARIIISDQSIHTWDLAKALGRSHNIPQSQAEVAMQLLEQFANPDTRGPDKGFDVAQPCSDDAPLQDRLLAFSGRKL